MPLNEKLILYRLDELHRQQKDVLIEIKSMKLSCLDYAPRLQKCEFRLDAVEQITEPLKKKLFNFFLTIIPYAILAIGVVLVVLKVRL